MKKPKAEKVEITIDKEIPLPSHRGKPSPYPIAQLQIGDSFFAKDKSVSSMWNEIVRVKNQFAENDKRSFAVRTVEGGVRVWRTK
jgi:hypothetical protein